MKTQNYEGPMMEIVEINSDIIATSNSIDLPDIEF